MLEQLEEKDFELTRFAKRNERQRQRVRKEVSKRKDAETQLEVQKSKCLYLTHIPIYNLLTITILYSEVETEAVLDKLKMEQERRREDVKSLTFENEDLKVHCVLIPSKFMLSASPHPFLLLHFVLVSLTSPLCCSILFLFFPLFFSPVLSSLSPSLLPSSPSFL